MKKKILLAIAVVVVGRWLYRLATNNEPKKQSEVLTK